MAIWIKSVLDSLSPILMDENASGKKKFSIGRAPLFVVLAIMCQRYYLLGEEPGQGVLAFIALAMAYNGFSKTKLAKADTPDLSSTQVNQETAPSSVGD